MRVLLDKQLVTAEVCTLFLPNANLNPDALFERIGVADPVVMTGRIIADNAQIMNF